MLVQEVASRSQVSKPSSKSRSDVVRALELSSTNGSFRRPPQLIRPNFVAGSNSFCKRQNCRYDLSPRSNLVLAVVASTLSRLG